MCLFPRKIFTPFNSIHVSGGQPVIMDVPCGKCAECKKTSRLTWHFRTFYETLACVDKGGFILYDTLTYSDTYLPKLSHFYDISDKDITDFSCFNHQHFKDFLKRLRRRLDFHYKGVTFKYFLTSEYGTDERFTHRPHYHILFFVYTNGVYFDSLTLSKLISETWIYGRTDGLPYQPAEYVKNNTFVKGNTIDYKPYLRVCSYVSKYITKDSEFTQELEKRKFVLSKYTTDDELKELSRNIDMFHRQSQGFGASYLDSLSADEYDFILKNGACRIKDDKKVTVTIPLPLYYKRKLFYKSVKYTDVDGKKKIKWVPTQVGRDYLYNSYIRNIETHAKFLRDTLCNMSDTDTKRINSLLQERSLYDLAIYNLYYKGYTNDMLSYTETFDVIRSLSDNDYNLFDWLNKIILRKSEVYTDNHFYLRRDKEHKTIDVITHNHIFHNKPFTHDYQTFITKTTFNQNTSPHFRNFDLINNIIRNYTYNAAQKEQRYFDHVENMKKRYKYIFNQ